MSLKKSLGPVVASSFLLIVVVISTVTFQNWFTGFEASTLAGAESKTAGSSNGTTRIQDVIGTSLYFQNGFPNISIQSVRIYEYDCNVSTTLGSGLSTVALGNNCTQNLPSERAEISIVTDKGVFRGNFYNEHAGVNTSVPVGGSPVSPTPSISLSTNDSSIDYNGNINLSWTASNVASCSASGGWSGSKSNTTSSEVISSLTSNSTFTLNCTGTYGNISDSVDIIVGANPCPPSNITFIYTGSNQTFTVPTACNLLTFNLWGAGGGMSSSPGDTGFGYVYVGAGGAGGFTTSNYSVNPGDNFTVIVGRGGPYESTSVIFGGGGATNGVTAGNGGGRSAIRESDGTEILTAGGGGGGTYYYVTNSPGVGGAGGGTTGESGTGYLPGSGGGQSSGGSGAQSGRKFRGGDGVLGTFFSGGTGGGGWYGGGSGSHIEYDRGGGGGGGSGYCGISNCTTIGGSGTTPGGQSYSGYSSGIGEGGDSWGEAGGHGKIVVFYS